MNQYCYFLKGANFYVGKMNKLTTP